MRGLVNWVVSSRRSRILSKPSSSELKVKFPLGLPSSKVIKTNHLLDKSFWISIVSSYSVPSFLIEPLVSDIFDPPVFTLTVVLFLLYNFFFNSTYSLLIQQSIFLDIFLRYPSFPPLPLLISSSVEFLEALRALPFLTSYLSVFAPFFKKAFFSGTLGFDFSIMEIWLVGREGGEVIGDVAFDLLRSTDPLDYRAA